MWKKLGLGLPLGLPHLSVCFSPPPGRGGELHRAQLRRMAQIHAYVGNTCVCPGLATLSGRGSSYKERDVDLYVSEICVALLFAFGTRTS